MTSFGFSIGDVVLVANYAYSVYKSCKNAGDNFREITADINSLHSLLNALSNEYENPRSSFRYLPPDQEGQLAARLEDCKADLRSVKTILNDFRSLDTHHARYRDKLAFTSEKQAAIREKIVAHGARLQQFLSGTNVATFSRIENNTEVNGHILREIYVKVDMIQKDRFPCRRNAPERALSGNGLTLKNKTQKAITSSLRNASKITLTGDALAPENITPKAMTSGLRNTSKRTTSGGELASKNKTHKNNKTQVDVNSLSRLDGWHDQDSRNTSRPAKKRHPSSQLFNANAIASLASTTSCPSLENAKKVTSDPTVALVKNDANQLISLKGFPTFEEAYHHHEKKMECMRTEDWSNLSPVENTFYILRFSYEELCSGTSRRINVRRRTRSKKTPSEHLSLKVKVEKGYTDVYGLQFIGAGTQCAGYTKNLFFAVTCKKHKLFSRHQSNLAHGISISVAEAIDGWRREIRHPSGTLIELHAYGPTNVRHFLEMYNYGLPYRTSPEAHGSLLLWIQVTDIEDASVGQLDQLEYEGGAYFARIKGEEGRRFESTHEEAVDLLAFGDKAISHSKLLSAGFKKRMNDVEKSPRRKVTPTEGKKRPRSPSHLS